MVLFSRGPRVVSEVTLADVSRLLQNLTAQSLETRARGPSQALTSTSPYISLQLAHRGRVLQRLLRLLAQMRCRSGITRSAIGWKLSWFATFWRTLAPTTCMRLKRLRDVHFRSRHHGRTCLHDIHTDMIWK